MSEQADGIIKEAQPRIAAAVDLQALEAIRIEFLGPQGKITALLRGLSKLPAEERPTAGEAANRARALIEEALSNRKEQLQTAGEKLRVEDILDVTIPGRRPMVGHQHPLTQVREEICNIFIGLGFEAVEGPEVETFYYGFEALNYPPDHPAIDETDTYYITDDVLLRSQTSSVQIREMEKRAPAPIRLVVPGRVYRRENITMTHGDTFYQLEGLLVDRGINFNHLKGILESFAMQYFGPQTRVIIRPDFFPFVEPGGDFSIDCNFCDGKGCKFCKESGWIELGGCGMVHPNVLRAGGYDPEVFSGFAFGFGIDRLTQRRFSIDHIRLLYENDMRFLAEF